jgi:amino acid adenylation domain-containing protein
MLSELMNFSTLVDVLQWRAKHQPNRIGYVFLNDGETVGKTLTYQMLERQAIEIASQLQSNAACGDRALLIYPPGLGFIVAFLGCLYAGIVAVPVDMPRRNQRTQRLQKIVGDTQAKVILSVREVLPMLRDNFPSDCSVEFLATDTLATNGLNHLYVPPEISSDSLALLQYTSGSTGNPKGVMVSHGNLLHNEEMIKQAFRHSESTVFVGWLPLFHDMGLMGNVLQPLYLGIPSYLMSPIAFLQKPIRWLQAIDKYKATTSGGPNFAYDLCVRKITSEQCVQLDLSRWSLAFNAAEPVSIETLTLFSEKFREYGFNPDVFYPCYGMAETTSLITSARGSASSLVRHVDSAALSLNRIIIGNQHTSTLKNKDLTPIISCGRAWLDAEIAIVDPDSLTRCAPELVGEIWVASESVAKGYWNRLEDTAQIFQAQLKDDVCDRLFLRTGDLGFLHEGMLFVIGRLKDHIKKVEQVESVPSSKVWNRPNLSADQKSMNLSQKIDSSYSNNEIAVIPLTRAQQQLWFLAQLGNNSSAAYNESIILQLQGVLNLAAIQKALQKIVDRHESLRTRISPEGDFQHIILSVRVDVPVLDFTHLIGNEQQFKVETWLQEESQVSFDFTKDSLFRCQLLKLSERLHLLVISAHHIIIDGWSMGLMLQEIAAIYSAECNGNDRPLTPVLQFREYAQWLEEQAETEAMASHQSYWLEQLYEPIPVLELPTDRSRRATKTFRANRQTVRLETNLCNDLQKISREQGCTLFMTMLAAYKTLLHRLTGQDDILIGTPTAGRSLEGSQELVGYCTHLLPIRSKFVDNPSFIEYLHTLRGVLLDAYEHLDYPFANLLYHLSEQRQTNYSPLITATFNLEPSLTAPQMFGLDTSLYSNPIGFSDYDLNLDVIKLNTEFVLSCDYSTDLFDAATISRLLGHFQTLLSAIVENPQQLVSTLPLLTPTERHQLLVEWNDTEREYPQDKCIHQVFEEQVVKTPDAIAVMFEEQQLTYRELNQKANQFAHYLQTLGVEPEVLVGICVERSLEMVIGMLGILKAGGAYVPLDPGYPAERLSYMLSDAGVKVLLTQNNLLSILPSNSARMVCLNTDLEIIESHSRKNLVTGVSGANLAYVIYTSGSTGTPKGVCCNHLGVLNLCADFHSRKPLVVGERCSLWTSLSFDVSVYEIFSTLCAGAALHIVPEPIRLDAITFINWLSAQQICSAYIPPFMLQAICERLSQVPNQLSLQRLLVGVEPIYEQLLISLSQLIPGLHIINGYGPSETTICATLYSVQSQDVGNRNTPIGKPVQNTEIFLLDKQMQQVPIGVSGEIYISGIGLARGYLNRPDLTAAKFIPNPFSDEPHSRLYKTGDLARYLPDGDIEYLGRIDHQVKIRGFRIELGEIETVLSSHPQIQQAVTIAAEDATGNKRLVAYVVVSEVETFRTQQLREFLQEQLPVYMVPSTFVILDTLPLTPNGKVDRKALPEPHGEIDREQEYVAPRTPNEEIIAQIFTTVLGVETVSIHDNFFELGGHSLLATQLTSRLKQSFTVEVPLRVIFEFPTVAQLDQTISQLRTQGQELSLPAIERIAPDTKDIPLSFAQERLWFFNQLEGASATYNIPAALCLTGILNLGALHQALAEIVRRHEALRTSFSNTGGRPIQIIHPSATMDLEVIDLQHLSVNDRESMVTQQIQQSALSPFDLEIAPLMQCSVLQLSQTESVFCINMHHIVSDGWSIGVLVQELSALYSAYCAGEPSPLSELEVQYADFALWQRQWLSGEVLERQLQYWVSQLQGIPELLQLPTDRPRPSIQAYRGTTASFPLGQELTEQLKALSQQTGCTLFITLLSAFATLLYRYSGQSDIVIGSPIANRNQPEIESLIGFFVNTLVLRTQMEEQLSFDHLLQQVRETVLKAYEHQEVPFEKVVEALQPQRCLSHSPLFQVMFILQNMPLDEIELPGINLSRIEQESTSAKFDIALSIVETSLGLDCEWEYSTDLFDESTIKQMASHFESLLLAIVSNPQQPVSELPLLTPAERQQLLFDWNNPQADYFQDKCIHKLFEEQVWIRPGAIALVHDQEQLSYGHLNERANQLGHYLQSEGVSSETIVGLCVERSIEMVVGILGIIKAGGAYLPLDPNYPKERLEFMMDDAGVSWVLTQEELENELPEHKAQVLCLDRDWDRVCTHSTENIATRVRPEELAYVIYTSGSTGTPKGVLIEHRNVTRLFEATDEWFGFDSEDVWTLFHSYAFDFSVWEMWGALLHGGQLVVVPHWVSRSPEDFYRLISNQRVTVLNQTPSAFVQLMQAEERGNPADLNLRLVVFGGEALEVRSLRPWFERHGDKRPQLVNMYGITETTVHVTYRPLEMSDLERGSSVIGKPIPDLQTYLLDEHLQLVPIGVAGELYVGGAGVARGYLNREQLTTERFIADPFGGKVGSRLYRTGDLGRYLRDGNIEFLGRADQQVKIRGFRIELGEIEAALIEHPDLRQVTVISIQDTSEDKRLVAYLVSYVIEQKPSVSDLRQFLKAKLPDYMIPVAYVYLDTLPLTPTGKIDRQAFPFPDQSLLLLNQSFAPPQNNTERKLARIWSDVLDIEKIGIDDDFFAIGGDSLKAVRIVQKFGSSLSVSDLLRDSNIRELARTVDCNRESDIGILHRVTRTIRNPKISLICIPYGGGSAVVYHPLANALPSNYALYSVDPPRRDFSQNEKPRSLIEIAAICVQEIKTKVTGPIALYGHCAGAALTVEIARLLENSNYKIEAVFLGAVLPPVQQKLFKLKLDNIFPIFDQLSDRKIYNFLNKLGAFDDGIDAQELEFFTRAFRHDIQRTTEYLEMMYKTKNLPKFKAPIHSIFGSEDQLTKNHHKRFKGWNQFSNSVGLTVIDGGGHYFLKHQASELAKTIIELLEGLT